MANNQRMSSICPVTLEPLNQPVILLNSNGGVLGGGHLFEESTLLDWLKTNPTNPTNPLTGEKLPVKREENTVTPLFTIQKCIVTTEPLGETSDEITALQTELEILHKCLTSIQKDAEDKQAAAIQAAEEYLNILFEQELLEINQVLKFHEIHTLALQAENKELYWSNQEQKSRVSLLENDNGTLRRRVGQLERSNKKLRKEKKILMDEFQQTTTQGKGIQMATKSQEKSQEKCSTCMGSHVVSAGILNNPEIVKVCVDCKKAKKPRQITCKNCGETGHNKRTCTFTFVVPTTPPPQTPPTSPPPPPIKWE